jgi:hypothetical protein
MSTIGRLVLAAAVLGWSAGSVLAQAPKSVTPDLARRHDGKSAQVFNRGLAVAAESGRTVVRLDARMGDGGVLLEGIQPGEGVIEVHLKGKDVVTSRDMQLATALGGPPAVEEPGPAPAPVPADALTRARAAASSPTPAR